MGRIAQSIRRFEDWWISDEIAAVPIQMGKARLILRVCLYCLPPVVLILGMGWFQFPERRTQTLLVFVGHLLVSGSIFPLRWAKNVAMSGTIFLVAGALQLLGAAYMTGSIVSPVVYAFPVLVVFASTLVRIQLGLWVGMVLLVGAWFIWMPNLAAYEAWTEHAPMPIRLLTLGWSMATALGVAWLYKLESRRSEAELREAIAERDRFVAYISHELRNPLTAILGAADLLQLEETDPRKVRLVDALFRSAQGMTRVLDDLLDISRADAGMLSLELHPTAVQPLLTGMFSELGPLAEARGIRLQLDNEGPGDLHVRSVERRLEQVLRNLLYNSLKFTESGGEVTLRVGVEEEGSVRFDVIDTGIGIEPSKIQSMLEPFRQADATATGGTGLGLPISRLLLAAMNSELQIESVLGEGSRFGFVLPAAEALAARPSTSEPAAVVAPAPRAVDGMQVLLADDNVEAREVIGGLLETLGCQVQLAADGLQALEAASEVSPGVILLDIQMPKLDGIQTARELRQRFSVGVLEPCRLIAVTGNVDAETRLMETGLFDEVLAKPVRLAQLEACVGKVVG